MAFTTRDTQAYREHERSEHRKLGVEEREELVKNYLPAQPRERSRSREKKQKKISSRLGVRKFLKSGFYALLFVLVHAIFSVYIRIRIAYHAVTNRVVSILKYHHNTPEYVRRDVSKLGRLPRHLSVILTLEDGGRPGDALEKLVNEASEVTAWCASAGIPTLSIYEQTGILKTYMPQVHRALSQKLKSWYGKHYAPSLRLASRGTSPVLSPVRDYTHQDQRLLDVVLISEEDGREAMVDLTRVLASMMQKDKIAVEDVTLDVIDNELSEAVMAEPDLLISFEPYVGLQGYPPWPLRLTEIYCSPDNQGVGYQTFLKGLRKYTEATFKLGR